MASYLLDTNVILRLIDRNDAKHNVCVAAVDAIMRSQSEICLAPQVLIEFWVVATRPVENNGLGWSPETTDTHISHLCDLFRLRSEDAELFHLWRKLVKQASIRGKRTHDARIAAFLKLHGIDSILTLNPDDFRSLSVNVIEPDSVSPKLSRFDRI